MQTSGVGHILTCSSPLVFSPCAPYRPDLRLQVISRLPIGAFKACHIHARSHLVFGEVAARSPGLDQSFMEGWRDWSHLSTDRQRLVSILALRSDVDGVHVAGVRVGNESVASAGGDQLINDGVKGVFIPSVAVWKWLTRDDYGFRHTDARKRVSCGCRCRLRSKLSDRAGAIPLWRGRIDSSWQEHGTWLRRVIVQPETPGPAANWVGQDVVVVNNHGSGLTHHRSDWLAIGDRSCSAELLVAVLALVWTVA